MAARRAAGLSQQALADRAQISQPYLSKIERGEARPGDELARSIAAIVGSTVEQLWPRRFGGAP